jgi:hypothetical protein
VYIGGHRHVAYLQVGDSWHVIAVSQALPSIAVAGTLRLSTENLDADDGDDDDDEDDDHSPEETSGDSCARSWRFTKCWSNRISTELSHGPSGADEFNAQIAQIAKAFDGEPFLGKIRIQVFAPHGLVRYCSKQREPATKSVVAASR